MYFIVTTRDIKHWTIYSDIVSICTWYLRIELGTISEYTHINGKHLEREYTVVESVYNMQLQKAILTYTRAASQMTPTLKATMLYGKGCTGDIY
ncbi:hypothetical protein GDO78_020068 [Eleutherodactylus coqui]|uniref:Uncharacterized protein n=1 Tax=Eleutherodactylus coqui TaxID=57060 RepID=A0A8J6BKA0_ELECQ|nr:hypothetical protein GDO78_020068 [Eleutherodactylus coqui]